MSHLRNTPAGQFYQATKDGMITRIVAVQTESKETEEITAIPPDQFIKDLEMYLDAGIFSESLDIKYQLTAPNFLQLQIGYLSPYCNKITADFHVAKGITMEQVRKALGR